ncbi:hypothetical protein BCF74_10642 [Knoellia remsis]|uniref:Uncharacterized protein n=1 Tax=Knoellia remsis TaxID=407159 RepID=A0A2T0UTR7_9MICO|nr:hypothetical protein [Knoellia remsis]PRY61294.1 hypothetical protein BCF74_10642 [Knoellia remsis]
MLLFLTLLSLLFLIPVWMLGQAVHVAMVQRSPWAPFVADGLGQYHGAANIRLNQALQADRPGSTLGLVVRWGYLLMTGLAGVGFIVWLWWTYGSWI